MSSRRRFLRAVGAVGLAAAGGCSSDGTGTTAPPSTTRERSSSTPAEPPTADRSTTADEPTAEREGADRIAWERSLPGAVDSWPVLAGDVLVVGGDEGTVTALARTDGSVVWEYDAGAPIQGRPVVAGEAVVVVSGRMELFEHHTVHALDVADGNRRFTFGPAEWWLDVLGWGGDVVFVATHDDAPEAGGETLYALARADGTVRWSVEVGDARGGFVAADAVYVPSPGAVDAVGLDGTHRWRVEGGEYRYNTLCVAGDTAAFMTADDPRRPTVVGVDATTGDERWRFDDWRAHTTHAAGERLFVGGERVARLDPADGTVSWEADRKTTLYGAIVADGRLYAAGETAAAFDVADGTVDWTTDLDAYLARPAGLAGERLLVKKSAGEDDRDRHLLALDAATGERQWAFAGRRRLSDPAVGPERAYLAAGSQVLALAM